MNKDNNILLLPLMSRRISRQYQARAILLLRNFIAFQFFKEVLNLVEKTVKIKNFFKKLKSYASGAKKEIHVPI